MKLPDSHFYVETAPQLITAEVRLDPSTGIATVYDNVGSMVARLMDLDSATVYVERIVCKYPREWFHWAQI